MAAAAAAASAARIDAHGELATLIETTVEAAQAPPDAESLKQLKRLCK